VIPAGVHTEEMGSMNRFRIGLVLGSVVVLVMAGLGVRNGLLGIRSASAIDLSGVPAKQHLWAVFKDFLKEEDRKLREYGEGRKGQIAVYGQHRADFRDLLTVSESAVDWEELEKLETLEKLSQVLDQVDWACNEGGNRDYEALMADLEKALVERVAALEVLRFATVAHSTGLRDRDVRMIWRIVLSDAGGNRQIKGSLSSLYAARVKELTAKLAEEGF